VVDWVNSFARFFAMQLKNLEKGKKKREQK